MTGLAQDDSCSKPGRTTIELNRPAESRQDGKGGKRPRRTIRCYRGRVYLWTLLRPLVLCRVEHAEPQYTLDLMRLDGYELPNTTS